MAFLNEKCSFGNTAASSSVVDYNHSQGVILDSQDVIYGHSCCGEVGIIERFT